MPFYAAPHAPDEPKLERDLSGLSDLSDHALESLINPKRIPRHVAIIMDGNGRWARERALPRVEGHRAAVESVWEVVDECGRLHIEALTLYAFSTENWKRPRSEVNALMRLFREQLRKQTPRLHRNNVRLQGIGDLRSLPLAVRWELRRATRRLARNSGLHLNLALSYGGRQEIVQAARRLAADVRRGVIRPDEITEDRFTQYLYTGFLPDPDLIIRTSGEMRLSNFLLWQSAYAEFYVTPVLWPDFRKRDLYAAILNYQSRERRFGGLVNASAPA